MKRRTRMLGPHGLWIALLMVAIQAAPASAAQVKFGSKLSTDDSQPQQGQYCSNDHNTNCTWVLVEAYHNPDKESAPRSGTIRKIKLVAFGPGSFKLFIARVRNGDQAKVVRAGPVINYTGGGDEPPYLIETFNVNVHVNEGDYLAVRAKRPQFLNCSGAEVLTFQPPLQVGGPFQTSDDDGPSCTLLIQAVMQ